MIVLEPRIYNIVLYFNDLKPWNLHQFCDDLGITAERKAPLAEDEWGIKGALELWFQEIEGNTLTLHIQKKHFIHKKRFLNELEDFFRDLDNLGYLDRYEEIR